MTISELNEVMKRCQDMMNINYIRPTIHVNSGRVTGIAIYPYHREKAKEFTITNSPEDYNLYEEVNRYLDSLDFRK